MIISDAELREIAASGRRYSSAAVGQDQNILWDVVDPDAGVPGWRKSLVRSEPVDAR